MRLDITRMFVRCSPVIQDITGGKQYTLAGVYDLASELEPVFWGEGDLLMFSGKYIDPVRGYRFRGQLATQGVDLNDYGVLNEYRRTSTPFRFYPWGTSRPYWIVYIPGSLFRYDKTTPFTQPAEFTMLGTRILSVEETKEIGIIVEPEVTYTTGGGPVTWNITAMWVPMITDGIISVTVIDENDNEDTGSAQLHVGVLRYVTSNITSEPIRAVFEHNLSPYKKEVNL